MSSIPSLSDLSSLLHPSSLALVTIAGALGLVWGRRSHPQMAMLAMDAVNTDRPPEPDLPTAHDATSIRELERLFRTLSQPENQVRVYRRFAQSAGIDLKAQEIWLLQRLGDIVGATEGDLASALRVPPDRLARVLASLQTARLVSTGTDSLCLTDEGRDILARMSVARNDRLAELFSEWAPGGHYEIQQIITRFTKTLYAQMPPEE
jgi:DNA-binding MarR family transcriptional regulator